MEVWESLCLPSQDLLYTAYVLWQHWSMGRKHKSQHKILISYKCRWVIQPITFATSSPIQTFIHSSRLSWFLSVIYRTSSPNILCKTLHNYQLKSDTNSPAFIVWRSLQKTLSGIYFRIHKLLIPNICSKMAFLKTCIIAWKFVKLKWKAIHEMGVN